MRPGRKRLPISQRWDSEDEYVQSLLTFATTSTIFSNLCGGVHILDFLTREPDLYSTVLPATWRDWFEGVSMDDVLEFLFRSDLRALQQQPPVLKGLSEGVSAPPASLVEYVVTIREHSLLRDFSPVSDKITDLPPHVAVGMKPKKIHEVTNFAAYVSDLSADLSDQLHEPVSVVDFGSGQNYLGRTLASPPYRKTVIAIERKHHNIDGARSMDVHARLAKKEKIMRNKKEWKRQQLALANDMPTPPPEVNREKSAVHVPDVVLEPSNEPQTQFYHDGGSMTYVEHDIQDGHLENILYPRDDQQDTDKHLNSDSKPSKQHANSPSTGSARPKAMVVSLHSCGNLLHHGLRSLIVNPSVCAVAMIGCCYNLMTERLGPATYKLPQLRPNHPRLEATGNAYDPHGFPLSKTLETFAPSTRDPDSELGASSAHVEPGVRLNITARMMAVQAPYNWGREDSEAFFRRHFYRALLQRILLDLGVVHQCTDPGSVAGGSVTGKDTRGTPLIVGSLGKACFASFRAYVRGALAKLAADPDDGATIARLTAGLDDDTVARYEARWAFARKNLAVIWSLMAFSAGVVESLVAVDRWLFLREQHCVADCWVEPVFDYAHSPRNLVVVGIKRA